MTSVMASPASPGRPDWRPGHAPKLSYRNPLPPGEVLPERNGQFNPSLEKRLDGPGLSIREIRGNLPKDSNGMPNSLPVSPSLNQSQKNKRSFLGGLFVKEPSMAALDQVAQQMLAQHGSISPRTVPHVSSAKMPEHVPKVNSKWDGVPEHVRKREKQEKDRIKLGPAGSIRPSDFRSRSTDLQDDQSVLRRRRSNDASTIQSWDSRSSGSRPAFQDDLSLRPESIYSTSSDDSGQAIQRPASVAPAPSSHSSVSKHPSTLCYVGGTPATSKGLHRLLSSQSTSTRSTTSSSQYQVDNAARVCVPPVEAIPEYTSSPAITPLERSPKTPSPFPDDEKSLDAALKVATMLPGSVYPAASLKPPSATARGSDGRSANGPKAALKAGLVLQTTNLVAPWESQSLSNVASKSPVSGTPMSPLARMRLFGRDRR